MTVVPPAPPRYLRWAVNSHVATAVALALAGCTFFATATPPATPPTAPAPTVTPLPPTPLATVSPAVPTTPAPTEAPPPSEDPAGPEAILILEPGLSSRVASPVRVAGFAEPTFEQNLVIQVTDEAGAVLNTTPTTIQADVGAAGPYAQDVTFAVTSEQPGRISVYHASARDGGLVHLASVEVTLLPSGAASVTPAASHSEIHAIDLPAHLAEVSGGVVHVEGFSEYVFEATLALALCGEGGSGAPDLVCGTADNVIAAGIAMIASPDIGLAGPFSGDLAYAIAAPAQARLVVYSTSARDGGLTHLSSRPISLQP